MAMPPQGGGGGVPLILKFMATLLLLVTLVRAGSDPKGASTVITTTAPQMGNRYPHQQQRLQLLQEAQQLEAAHQHHHHLRHEQHLRAELEGNHKPPSVGVGPGAATAMKLFDQQLPPAATGQQQHHLRHHNRHHVTWEQRVFPSLRHQQHRLAMSSTARPIVTTDAPHPTHSMMSNHSRYFDRDGIYPPWAEPRSTRGPNWRQQVEVDSSSKDDDDDDDDADDDDDEDYEYEEDSSSNAVDEELARQMPRYSLFSQKLPHIESREEEYDAYDQSDESDMNSNRNRHPSVANPHDKAAAKRNIFDWLFKRDKEKEQDKQKTHKDHALVAVRKPHTTEKPTEKATEKATVKPKLQLIDANLQVEEDEDEDSPDDSDSDTDSEESFSNEQWNKIEHEHHLKQQKHQKELQALRESSRNTPLIRPAAAAASYNIENEVSAGKTLEDGNDGHDVENIYSPNYITGKLTQKKEEQLGTPEAALKTRRQQALMQKRERALAQAHMHQVMTDATCRVPQPRCQRVQQDPSKIYTPHCTVLHRCSEDSGCCPSRTQLCAAKSTHNVELHFFVKSNKQHRPIIEKRTFVNHTECHCIERSNFKEDAVALASTSIVRATILSCTCPRSFEVILQDNGQCRCDCSSGNYDCDWLKRGNEHFAVDDRKCIKHGGCKPPTCEFGHYMDKHGRCPKQHEQPVYNAMS